MTQTEHYDLNIVVGSDLFNPLTQSNPNFEKIDDVMYNNSIAGITTAVHLLGDTVNALTRVNKDCPVFRFTATSDYTAGQTFTVDGIVVTAQMTNGKSLSTNAFKINSNVLCILQGTLLTMYVQSDVTQAEDALKLGGQLPEYYATANTQGINTYTQNSAGLTGEGENGKFVCTQAGTFYSLNVNGQSYSVNAGGDTNIELKLGAVYFFMLNGTTINFNRGGGLSNSELEKANAQITDVAEGKTFYAGDKTLKTGVAGKIFKGDFTSLYNDTITINLGYRPKTLVLTYRYSGADTNNQTIIYNAGDMSKRYRIVQSRTPYEDENVPGDVYGYVEFTDTGFTFWGYYGSSGNQKIVYYAVV